MSWTGWIPPSPLVQINLYQGEILPYNTELVGQAFGSLVGWIVREDRSSAFQSERGQVHRPTEQILLGNQVHLYQGFLNSFWGKFWLFVLYQGGSNNQTPKITKKFARLDEKYAGGMVILSIPLGLFPPPVSGKNLARETFSGLGTK